MPKQRTRHNERLGTMPCGFMDEMPAKDCLSELPGGTPESETIQPWTGRSEQGQREREQTRWPRWRDAACKADSHPAHVLTCTAASRLPPRACGTELLPCSPAVRSCPHTFCNKLSSPSPSSPLAPRILFSAYMSSSTLSCASSRFCLRPSTSPAYHLETTLSF